MFPKTSVGKVRISQNACFAQGWKIVAPEIKVKKTQLL